MAENRLAREVENRESAQRKMAWTPPSTLPPLPEEEGWVFRYIRTSIMGNADPSNVSAKLREGWEPVKAEDYPALKIQADPNSRFKGNIEIGGLLVCKAPKELMQQRDDYYAHQARAQIQSVDNSFMRLNDERMPLFNERKTSVSFGKGK
jgi:hypothetical protein